MAKTVFQLILLTVIMVLLQVFCSKILLFNVAMPIIFIYVIMRLPINMSTNWVLTISFVLGLVVDIFSNTQGMNALSCTIMGALRHPAFNAFQAREDDMSNPLPSIHSLGFETYAKYATTLTVLYCFLIFTIQAFTLRNFSLTLIRIGASSLLSVVFILGIDSFVSTRREKRL